MKKMPNITLTSGEFNRIIEFGSFNREGGESIICRSNKKDTLYKICYDINNQEVIEMSNNKFQKLLALYEMDLEYSVKVLSTISVNGHLLGYEMTYDPKDIPLDKANLNRGQIIDILRNTREALIYYSGKKITYGDVKSNNILVNRRTNRITFCDMDNVQIENHPIDIMGRQLKDFYDEFGKIDSFADAYMHNLLTLQQLGFPNKYTTIEGIILTLKSGTLPQEGFDKEAIDTFYSMITPKKFNGEYVVEYVKK